MIKNLIGQVESLTSLVISLLALAIVASLLVGSGNMAFFGGVVTNITGLVAKRIITGQEPHYGERLPRPLRGHN